MTTMLTDRLAALTTLAHGAHDSPADGLCAMEAAAWLAGEPHSDHPACVSPVIAADAVNHGSKSSTFRQRSTDYRNQYLKHMGLDERRAAPASVTVDLDQNTSLGTGRIWRRKGYR